MRGSETDAGGPVQPRCEAGQHLKCVVDIDNGTVCSCVSDAWDPCVKYPEKYCAPMPVPPDGSTDWECSWNEFEYTCTKKGGGPPPGSSEWSCVPNTSGGWSCKRTTVPTPPGGGSWSCTVDNEADVLTCEKDQPPGGLTWKCVTGSDGKQVCTTTGGLPTGGSNWKCHKDGNTWVCVGETPPGSPPPGGNGWSCVKLKTEFGKEIYSCKKNGDDVPPGGNKYTCVKGTEFNGTQCVEGVPPPPPEVGQKCTVGDKAWCDGLTYCGWGQVVCDPKTNTWATKVLPGGQVVLNCYEVNDLRPNTVCACYHTLYNAACCERSDCIIPPGTNGQVCPKSAGKLCDYCNPVSPECSEPGGKCIISTSNETYCGKACSASQPCPSSYNCIQVKVKTGTINQCVPADMSCYY